jgi:hypothetical protein
MNTTDQSLQFPALPHRELLRQKCEVAIGRDEIGIDVKRLTDDERWNWFAYLYGCKRAFLHNDGRSLAVDPRGEWYDADLAERAAQMYGGNPTLRPTISPADQAAHNGDLERASRYRAQDRKREEYRRRITTERNADGTPTPEALRFAEVCLRQVKANMAEFVARNNAALSQRHYVEQPVAAE